MYIIMYYLLSWELLNSTWIHPFLGKWIVWFSFSFLALVAKNLVPVARTIGTHPAPNRQIVLVAPRLQLAWTAYSAGNSAVPLKYNRAQLPESHGTPCRGSVTPACGMFHNMLISVFSDFLELTDCVGVALLALDSRFFEVSSHFLGL